MKGGPPFFIFIVFLNGILKIFKKNPCLPEISGGMGTKNGLKRKFIAKNDENHLPSTHEQGGMRA